MSFRPPAPPAENSAPAPVLKRKIMLFKKNTLLILYFDKKKMVFVWFHGREWIKEWECEWTKAVPKKYFYIERIGAEKRIE